MIGLIKALRLPECLLVVALGIISFKYASIPFNILVLITLFFVIASTMLQNDWRDRFHDIAKSKTFAHEEPALFLRLLILFWVICCGLIMILFIQHPSTASLLLVMALVGAFYSEARRVPLLSVIIVSLTSASPLLLPLTFGASFATITNLFIATVLILFGRETLHDIADMAADKGYKQTVPVIMGDKFARIVLTIALIIGCGFVVAVSPFALIGVAFIVLGLMNVTKDALVIQVRKRIDIGLVLLVVILLLA